MNEKLGRAAYLTIGTTDISESVNLYNKLGYTVESEGDTPVRWSEICDGSLHIILVEGRDEYLGLTYVSDDIKASMETLKAAGLRPVITAGQDEAPKQIIAQLRKGMLVSVNQAVAEVDYNYTSKTLMDIDYTSPRPEDFPNEMCGIFGELALNIKDISEEIEFWERLGFKAKEQFDQPYPWAIVTDGLFTIGLHQTDEFTQPALTYFALDMPEKLKSLSDAGVKFLSESEKNSGRVATPEGQVFFLFPLGS